MTAKLSGLTLGFAIAVLAASPAMAGGDVIYTGIKDPFAAAVPVPAPIPVQTYEPDYYVRFDVGGGRIGGGTLEETGTPLEMREIGDIEAIEFGSIGAGRYITPSIRVELSVDLHTKAEVSYDSASFYTTSLTAPGPILTGPPVVNTFDTSFYDVTRTELVKYEQDIGLVNFYYDLRNSTRFTPYVGAGVGVTYRHVSRESVENAVCFDTTNTDPGTDGAYPIGYCPNTTALPRTYTVTDEDTVARWDIAAAAMTGFTYAITDDILWDNGYRFLWQNGTIVTNTATLTGTSRVEIGDITQHQFRTGIRLNLN